MCSCKFLIHFSTEEHSSTRKLIVLVFCLFSLYCMMFMAPFLVLVGVEYRGPSLRFSTLFFLFIFYIVITKPNRCS